MPQTSPEDHHKLTPKQELFVAAYIGPARFNASEAVRLAGYKTKNPDDMGYQLRKTPYIRERIDELLESNTVTGTEILRELSDVAMRGLHEFVEITRYDKDGNPVAARMDARAKMEALKLLGQNKGMYTEKHEHDLKGLTFADLHAIAAADEGASPVGTDKGQ